MKVEVGSATDIGRVRERNEDSVLVNPPLYVVADGMGGHRGGQVASQVALETMETLAAEGRGSLAEHVRQANRAVWDRSAEEEQLSGMGTHADGGADRRGQRPARPRRRFARVPAPRRRAPPAHDRSHPGGSGW